MIKINSTLSRTVIAILLINYFSASLFAQCDLNVELITTQPTCNQSDGSIQTVVTGAIGTVNYSWNPPTITGSEATGLSGGTTPTIYSVTVTDDVCSDNASTFIINDTRNCCDFFVNTDDAVLNCDPNSGLVTANVIDKPLSMGGAVEPITYEWSSGHTTQTVNFSNVGTYTVTVTDATGCSVTSTAVVTACDENDPLPNLVKNGSFEERWAHWERTRGDLIADFSINSDNAPCENNYASIHRMWPSIHQEVEGIMGGCKYDICFEARICGTTDLTLGWNGPNGRIKSWSTWLNGSEDIWEEFCFTNSTAPAGATSLIIEFRNCIDVDCVSITSECDACCEPVECMIQLEGEADTICAGSSVTIDVSANDMVEAGAQNINYSFVYSPPSTHGTSTLTNQGILVFNSNPSFSGEALFTYEVCYEKLNENTNMLEQCCDLANVSILVSPSEPFTIDLITNGSFEDGLNGWDLRREPVSVVTNPDFAPCEDSYAVAGPSETSPPAFIGQTVDVRNIGTCDLELKFSAHKCGSGNVDYTFSAFSEDGTRLQHNTSWIIGGWVDYSILVSIPPNTAYYEVIFQGAAVSSGNSQGGCFMVDCVELIASCSTECSPLVPCTADAVDDAGEFCASEGSIIINLAQNDVLQSGAQNINYSFIFEPDPGKGTATLTPAGSLNFTAASGFAGEVLMTYQLCYDNFNMETGELDQCCDIANITINVGDLTAGNKTNETCNDNSTATNSSDDYISFSLNPSGTNLGSGYTVSVNNGGVISPTSGTYGSITSFRLQNGSANGTLYTITITDNANVNCSITTTVQQGPCSNNCNLTGGNKTNETCNDNNTAANSTDDYISFSLNPTGTNLGTGYTVSVNNGGVISPTSASYGSATNFQLQAGSANGTLYTITITDNGDASCSRTTTVQQNSCSNSCNLTAGNKTNETCNDNSTATNSSDDYISFSLNPTGTNLGTGYTVSVNNGGVISPTSASYGSVTNFQLQAGSANGTLYTITITDNADASCSRTTTVQQNSCSNTCNLTGDGKTNEICNDNGTASDGSDDYISFDLNPAGTNLGSGYTVSVNNGGTISPTSGTYGAVTNFQLQAGSAIGDQYTITITDNADPSCSIATVVRQRSCSDKCNMTGSGELNEQCNSNNTDTDLSDDYISFDLNPAGDNLLNGYSVSVDNGGVISPTSGTYGTVTSFQLQAGSADGTLYTITITDNDDRDCSVTTTVQQGPCSNNCIPNENTICDDGSNSAQLVADPGYTNYVWYEYDDVNMTKGVQVGTGQILTITGTDIGPAGHKKVLYL